MKQNDTTNKLGRLNLNFSYLIEYQTDVRWSFFVSGVLQFNPLVISNEVRGESYTIFYQALVEDFSLRFEMTIRFVLPLIQLHRQPIRISKESKTLAGKLIHADILYYYPMLFYFLFGLRHIINLKS